MDLLQVNFSPIIVCSYSKSKCISIIFLVMFRVIFVVYFSFFVAVGELFCMVSNNCSDFVLIYNILFAFFFLFKEFMDDYEEETNEKVEATVPVKNVFYKVESGTSKQRKVDSKIPEEKGTTASEANAAPAPISQPDKNVLSDPPVGESNTGVKFASPPTTTPPIKFDFPSVPVLPTASLDVLAKTDEKPPRPVFSTDLKQQEKPETPVFSWASGSTGAKADSRLVITYHVFYNRTETCSETPPVLRNLLLINAFDEFLC